MSAAEKKSKKPFGANSKQPRKTFEVFVDRSLGKYVIADALRKAGSVVHIHDDHLPSDAPDEDWIALVGKSDWIAITKDKNIRYRQGEISAIKKHSAKVLVVRAKNTTGKDMAEVLTAALSRINTFADEHEAPFVAGINRSGKITKYDI